MKKVALVLTTVAGLLVASAHADEFNFSKRGSAWLGGGLSYSSMGTEYNDYRLNILQVAPILRFFPVDHFMIGPSLSWTGIFMDGGAINQFDMGAEIGAVFSIYDKAFPYIRSGGSLALIGGSGSAYAGFSLPIAGGVIIPVGRVFGIQIEPSISITWIESQSMNVFNISFGICGLGEKSAVSVMQGMSGITSYF